MLIGPRFQFRWFWGIYNIIWPSYKLVKLLADWPSKEDDKCAGKGSAAVRGADRDHLGRQSYRPQSAPRNISDGQYI